MNNVNVLIGLVTILLLLWTILYAIPTVLITFFHTMLGNIIILLCIYLVSIKNTNYGILLFVVAALFATCAHNIPVAKILVANSNCFFMIYFGF